MLRIKFEMITSKVQPKTKREADWCNRFTSFSTRIGFFYPPHRSHQRSFIGKITEYWPIDPINVDSIPVYCWPAKINISPDRWFRFLKHLTGSIYRIHLVVPDYTTLFVDCSLQSDSKLIMGNFFFVQKCLKLGERNYENVNFCYTSCSNNILIILLLSSFPIFASFILANSTLKTSNCTTLKLFIADFLYNCFSSGEKSFQTLSQCTIQIKIIFRL